MFCKKCGTKLDDNAQFCPSCGEKTESNNYQAPRPFETNSVDSSKNYQYQQSTFSGTQYSTGSSGKINFGSKRKGGLLGKLLRIIIIVIVIAFVYNFFFADNGPIYDIETASSVDYDTYEPVTVQNTFSTTTPEIFITFSIRDYPIGTDIQADWYYLDGVTSIDDGYIDSSLIEVEFEDQVAYISLTRPTNGWPVGEYEVDFFAGDDYVISVSFTVE